MTTTPHPASDAPTAAAVTPAFTDIPGRPGGGRLAAALARLRALPAFLSRERHWLLLAIPFLLSWVAPFQTQDHPFDGLLRWCWARWANTNSVLAFQPLVPLGAGLLVWSRREDLKAQWARLMRNHPRADDPKRHGNALPFALGCAVLFFGYCVQVKGVAVTGQVLIAVGAAYWVYGPVMLRALAVPLGFLCFLIPPPDSPIEKLAVKALYFSTEQAAVLLRLIHLPVSANIAGTSTFLRTDHYALEFLPYVSDGSGNLVCTVMLVFWYALYRRLRPNAALLMLAGGAVLALVLNTLRMAAAGALYGATPGLATFIRDMNGWIINVTAFALSLALTRALFRARILNAARPMKSAAVRAGMGLDAATRPIDAGLARGGKRIAALWSGSERAIEKMLKTLFPKRRKQRRSSGSSRRY